jgi:uncharacterized DUF497 family protein
MTYLERRASITRCLCGHKYRIVSQLTEPRNVYMMHIYMNLWPGCTGFNWDEGNVNKNWEKHGVADFECEEVFFNQPLIVRHDSKHSQHEARFYALGRTDSNRLLFVAFTVRRKLIRVISAREMTRSERRIYEAYDEQEKPKNPSDI